MTGAATRSPITDAPSADRYDVVTVGGAAIGSSIAWFLTQLGVDGTVLVVEQGDPDGGGPTTGRTPLDARTLLGVSPGGAGIAPAAGGS